MRKTLHLFMAMLSVIALPFDASAQRLSDPHMKFIACTDVQATKLYYSGLSAEKALESGIASCESELKRYVNELVEQVKSRHGWRSVQSEVYTEVRNNVIQTTIATMKPTYTAQKR